MFETRRFQQFFGNGFEGFLELGLCQEYKKSRRIIESDREKFYHQGWEVSYFKKAHYQLESLFPVLHCFYDILHVQLNRAKDGVN